MRPGPRGLLPARVGLHWNKPARRASLESRARELACEGDPIGDERRNVRRRWTNGRGARRRVAGPGTNLIAGGTAQAPHPLPHPAGHVLLVLEERAVTPRPLRLRNRCHLPASWPQSRRAQQTECCPSLLIRRLSRKLAREIEPGAEIDTQIDGNAGVVGTDLAAELDLRPACGDFGLTRGRLAALIQRQGIEDPTQPQIDGGFLPRAALATNTDPARNPGEIDFGRACEPATAPDVGSASIARIAANAQRGGGQTDLSGSLQSFDQTPAHVTRQRGNRRMGSERVRQNRAGTGATARATELSGALLPACREHQEHCERGQRGSTGGHRVCDFRIPAASGARAGEARR